MSSTKIGVKLSSASIAKDNNLLLKYSSDAASKQLGKSNISEIDLLLEKSISQIELEMKERKKDLEFLKKSIKLQKTEYNFKIKDYSTISKDISKSEKEMEMLRRKVDVLKQNNLHIVSRMDSQFLKELKSCIRKSNNIKRVLSGTLGVTIPEGKTYFVKFLKDKDELLGILNTATKQDCQLKAKLKDSLNLLYNEDKYISLKAVMEYLSTACEINCLKAQFNAVGLKNEEIIREKNNIFIKLKMMEGSILKNEKNSLNLSTQYKQLGQLLEKSKKLRIMPNTSEKALETQEISTQLNDLKFCIRTTFHSKKSTDGMDCLSLKSGYSDDFEAAVSGIDLQKRKSSDSKAYQRVTSTKNVSKDNRASRVKSNKSNNDLNKYLNSYLNQDERALAEEDLKYNLMEDDLSENIEQSKLKQLDTEINKPAKRGKDSFIETTNRTRVNNDFGILN